MKASVPIPETYVRDGEFLKCAACNANTLQRSCRHQAGCPAVGRLAFLSARQQTVARHVAAGRSNRWIAEQLDISVKTVEAHRCAVFRRLDVHEVAGLVHRMYELGVYEPEPKPEMSRELARARPLQPDPSGGRNFGRLDLTRPQ